MVTFQFYCLKQNIEMGIEPTTIVHTFRQYPTTSAVLGSAFIVEGHYNR